MVLSPDEWRNINGLRWCLLNHLAPVLPLLYYKHLPRKYCLQSDRSKYHTSWLAYSRVPHYVAGYPSASGGIRSGLYGVI